MKMLWMVVSTLSLLVIALTMLCRANDLRWRNGFKWQVRIVGFTLSGTMPIGVIGSQWYYHAWPSPYEALLYVGLACVFVTTPYLPPWWPWIKGDENASGTN